MIALKPRGVWTGNKFWKQSKAIRRGFVVSFRGLRQWQANNPEEAAKIQARFEKQRKEQHHAST